jgi:hypothetical protein
MAEHANDSNTIVERLLDRRDEFLRFVEARVDSRGTAEDILQSTFFVAW